MIIGDRGGGRQCCAGFSTYVITGQFHAILSTQIGLNDIFNNLSKIYFVKEAEI
jgi:hypothetical protein